ncbi:tyrosine-type recombinase/integrase [Planctomicrobium sp. SH664]|uniref:tyrosine-type recombinase/integrase n=1 Tax=Planctomicrobium sp. SH664 TaxID=3448125 RepID=UPI003F5B5DDA
MPRRTLPKYSLHRATGQARVRIDGKDHYLGVYGSAESNQRYTELLARWQRSSGKPVQDVTIGILTKLYLERCKTYYVKNGEQTGEVGSIRIALKRLNRKYRNLLARDFDSLKLKAVRELLIDERFVRTSINQHMSRIRGMFKWAASEKMVDQSVWLELRTVDGLKAGRSRALEPEPVGTVPDALVDAIKPHVTTTVWAMVSLQRLTGMRPGEVLRMRACDINMGGSVWEYIPGDHKTRHHGKRRIVLIGSQAQYILKPFLKSNLQAFLFDPSEGRQEFVGKEYRTGSRTAVRNARRQYSLEGYSCAIKRACDKAGVPRWTPNQLRHNFATRARREFGIEAARVTLGHSSAVTSEIYAERDLDAARAVVAKIG